MNNKLMNNKSIIIIQFRDSRKIHLERKVVILYDLAFDFVIANTVLFGRFFSVNSKFI